MEYSITVLELIKRPIIRTDHHEEFLNKMTDEEIENWYKEIEHNLLIDEIIVSKFPDLNDMFSSKFIDRSILYKLIKLGNNGK